MNFKFLVQLFEGNTGVMCDNLIGMHVEFNCSAVRGLKRPSEEGREGGKNSKEPMMNCDYTAKSSSVGVNAPCSLNAIGAATGVLHQLLGPVPPPPTPPPSVPPPPPPSVAPSSSSAVTATVPAPSGPAGGAFPSATATSSNSTSSKLCQNNKMLASLLGTPIQSTLSTNIGSPNPSGLPQEKLPKDLKVRSFFFPFSSFKI